jgi:hypothetical protein
MATHVLPIGQTSARPNMRALLGALVIRGLGLGLAGAAIILTVALLSLFLS